MNPVNGELLSYDALEELLGNSSTDGAECILCITCNVLIAGFKCRVGWFWYNWLAMQYGVRSTVYAAVCHQRSTVCLHSSVDWNFDFCTFNCGTRAENCLFEKRHQIFQKPE